MGNSRGAGFFSMHPIRLRCLPLKGDLEPCPGSDLAAVARSTRGSGPSRASSGGQTRRHLRGRHANLEKCSLSCAGPGEVAEWLKAAPC